MLTLPFECRLKLIFRGERLTLLILRLDHLKHSVVHGARFVQALFEQMILFPIHEKAVLQCSHRYALPQSIRNCQGPCLKSTHKLDSIGGNLAQKRDQSWHLCLLQIAKGATSLIYEWMSDLSENGGPFIMPASCNDFTEINRLLLAMGLQDQVVTFHSVNEPTTSGS